MATEDLLYKYIPDYPSGDKITIHHLLSHASGITDVNDLPESGIASLQPPTPETLVALFKNTPLEFQPGENMGTPVLYWTNQQAPRHAVNSIKKVVEA